MLIYTIVALFVATIIGLSYWNRKRAILHTLNIAELIPDALLIVDKEGNIKFANSNATYLFGYTKEELHEMTVEDLMPPRFRHMHKRQRVEFNDAPKVRPMGMGRDLYILTKEGTEVQAEIALSPASDMCVLTDQGYSTIVLLHDITARKQAEAKINHLAYYDQLTGIPNRTSFYEESKEIIKRTIENGRKLAFLILDIRDLKRINDTLGHYSGDDVIQKTGQIMKMCTEKFDCKKQDCVCDLKTNIYKISGNEFILLVEYSRNTHECIDALASSIIHEFKHPIRMDGTLLDIHINVNIGISLLSAHGVSSSQLLKTGDLALIKAKSQGTNTYCYYSKSMNTEFENFLFYENAIKYFIKSRDFDLSFQPVWSNVERKYVGAEVLFRCNDEKYPDMRVDFLINVAESTGLIIPLGNAILEKACEEAKRLDMSCDGTVLSVNASVQQIEEDEFSDKVVDILERTEFRPENLAIEITESTLMNKDIQVLEKINLLREQGVKIYIDDFGKGFSSLSYLRDIPADKLKIDMGFLKDIDTSKPAVEILRSIIHLGQAIELLVCTEGVETDKQMKVLKELGCDEIQGYFTGKPTDGETLREEYKDLFINYDR